LKPRNRLTGALANDTTTLYGTLYGNWSFQQVLHCKQFGLWNYGYLMTNKCCKITLMQLFISRALSIVYYKTKTISSFLYGTLTIVVISIICRV